MRKASSLEQAKLQAFCSFGRGLESVSLSVGPLNVATRPLKTTSEKDPHLSCVVFHMVAELSQL